MPKEKKQLSTRHPDAVQLSDIACAGPLSDFPLAAMLISQYKKHLKLSSIVSILQKNKFAVQVLQKLGKLIQAEAFLAIRAKECLHEPMVVIPPVQTGRHKAMRAQS